MKQQDYILPDATCMDCGRICETWEFIYTGDNETLDGYELWCYCPVCRIDTFHKPIIKK